MPSKSDIILITGATGKQGGAVARELLAAGYRVRAMTRHPDSENARELSSLGAEIVRGDLDDPGSLAKPLDGAWGAYAVQNTWEAGVEREEVQGLRFAEEARKAGVHHYVYASVGSAHRNTGVPHFENKWRIEQRVRELGFPSWVILRPVFFMENLLAPDTRQAVNNGTLPLGIKPTTKLQMIAVADLGKYGFAAFDQAEKFAGKAYDLASDALTMPEAADILSKVVNHPVKFVQVPIDQVRGFSEDLALMLEWFDAVGYDANIAATAREFGIKPTTFPEWAKTYWR